MIPLVTAFAVAVGLTLDATLPYWGHWAANGLVLVGWLLVFRAATRAERRGLVACVVLATLGEIFLCYGWGLYEYRYGNIPVFVPLGHSMIFLSGCRLAPKAPAATWKVVVGLTVPAVLVLAATGVDTAGLLWLPMFLACLLPRGTRHLYGTMFPVALAVEIAGTQVGSWWWFADVPWVSLTSMNPPLCAGVFYCVLDLLVLSTERLWLREARPAATDPVAGRAASE